MEIHSQIEERSLYQCDIIQLPFHKTSTRPLGQFWQHDHNHTIMNILRITQEPSRTSFTSKWIDLDKAPCHWQQFKANLQRWKLQLSEAHNFRTHILQIWNGNTQMFWRFQIDHVICDTPYSKVKLDTSLNMLMHINFRTILYSYAFQSSSW